MGIAGRDRSVEIVDLFRKRAEDSLRASLSPEIVAEYVANPVGPHSEELAALLRHFRAAPIAGKLAVVCLGRGVYRLCRTSGIRGIAPSVQSTSYASSDEAITEVFLRRVDELLGR